MAEDGSILEPDASQASYPGGSLVSRTLKGVGWTLVGDGGFYLIRFVSSIVLARLIDQTAFGIMAIVTAVQQGLYMFSDVGIHPAIVQHRRGDDPVFLNTAWTTQAIRGTSLWLCTFALCWPVAQYSKEPLLVYILPVVGLNSLIDGFVSTKIFTSDRHLSLGRLTVLNLGSAAIGLAARILWALKWPTVWALVAGGLATTVPRVLGSHWIIPGPLNRFSWDRQSLRELVHFGRWVFISTVLTFLAGQLDKFVFVKMIPLGVLGVYYMGSNFCRIPFETLSKIGSSVAFPALSRLSERRGNLESAYARMRAPILTVGATVMGMITIAGPLAIALLLPPKYRDAGWMMQILAVGLWFQVIQTTNQTVLLSQGQPKWLAVGNFIKIGCMAVVLPVAYYKWGFTGALVGMSAVEVPKYLFEASRVRGLGLGGWGIELGITAEVLLCAAAAYGLEHGSLGGSGVGLRLGLALGCFLVLFVPLLFWARKTARVFA